MIVLYVDRPSRLVDVGNVYTCVEMISPQFIEYHCFCLDGILIFFFVVDKDFISLTDYT